MKSLLTFMLVALIHALVPGSFGAVSVVGTNAPGVALSTNELPVISMVASNSLLSLKRHITPSNYQLMGFSNATEILTATNGPPLLVFTVPFSQLTNYVAGDFNSLLDSPPGTPLTTGLIIPIMVGTNVRSSNTLRLEKGPAGRPDRWVEGDWGHPQVIRNLITTYRAIPDADIFQNTVPFVVRIPIPRIWAIGYFTAGNIGKKLVLRATGDIRLGPVSISHYEIIPEAAMKVWATEARRVDPSIPN